MSGSIFPAPFLVSPTFSFDGNDGNWSTFAVDVGTPPQSFRLLPSNVGSETWVPISQGCQGVSISDCGSLRGVDNVNNTPSSGFSTNASSSWQALGIYGLSSEQYLFGSADNGLYGLDTVTPQSTDGVGYNMSSQIVAGIATADFWLGSLGLGYDLGSFSVQQKIPSLLDSMNSANLTPSLSFGYAAGAWYSSPPDYGSLVLGGYDRSRLTADSLSLPLSGASNLTAAVIVEDIVGQNVFSGTVSLNHNTSFAALIDSTVSQLWLPQSICDLFAGAFGLEFDANTGLYLVNSTTHNKLISMKPTVTFTIGSDRGNDSAITSIVMPYAAFELQASLPIYNTSTQYFPIRVAANESQQVLGRAFLQEAYLVVDWQRQNFTIGQVRHQNNTPDVVPILPVTAPSRSSSKSLTTGAIVGIAVGATVAVALAIGLALMLLRNKRRKVKAAASHPIEKADEMTDEKVAELHNDDVKVATIESDRVHEMEHKSSVAEVMSNPIMELSGETGAQELEADAKRDPSSRDKDERSKPIYELQ